MLAAEPELKWPRWRSDYATMYTTEETVCDSRPGAQTGCGANPAPYPLRTGSVLSEGHFCPPRSWGKNASCCNFMVWCLRAVTYLPAPARESVALRECVCNLLSHGREERKALCMFPHFKFWTSGLIFTKFVVIVVIGGHSRDVLNKFLPSGHGRRTNLWGIAPLAAPRIPPVTMLSYSRSWKMYEKFAKELCLWRLFRISTWPLEKSV